MRMLESLFNDQWSESNSTVRQVQGARVMTVVRLHVFVAVNDQTIAPVFDTLANELSR